MIRYGLLLLMVSIAPVYFISSIPALFVVMIFAGCGWACVNINSYPMICDMTTAENLGAITGLYYFFSMLAQTISPPIVGIVIDKTGNYSYIFLVAVVSFVLAFVSLTFVKAGEGEGEAKS